MGYKGRQDLGGQWALAPFNQLLSNWTTPYGLPPSGPQSIWEPGVMPPPPSAEQMVAAIQALLGLQTSQPQVMFVPVPVQAPPPPPAPKPEAPAAPSVEDRLARIEAALAALAAK